MPWNKRFAAKLLASKGQEIIDDIISLSKDKGTLQAVGTKHNLSRERIRQIYGKLFREPYSGVVKERATKFARKKLVVRLQKQNIVGKYARHEFNGSTVSKAINSEYKFYQECVKRGFVIKSHPKICCDFIVNDKYVDVKTTDEGKAYGKQSKFNQKYYRFGTDAKQKSKVSMFAFYIHPEDCFFIIPIEILGEGDVFYLPVYDIEYKGYHKYRDLQPYREAWHLLAR